MDALEPGTPCMLIGACCILHVQYIGYYCLVEGHCHCPCGASHEVRFKADNQARRVARRHLLPLRPEQSPVMKQVIKELEKLL